MPPDPLPASLEAGSTIRALAPGELLFRQGDPAAAIYKVESGRLRLIRRTVDDHLVILHTAHRGEFFAEASLFAGRRCAVEYPRLPEANRHGSHAHGPGARRGVHGATRLAV